MQIKEYKDLIANLPEKKYSFIIKKSNWENEKKVFEDNETLEISRNDLFKYILFKYKKRKRHLILKK